MATRLLNEFSVGLSFGGHYSLFIYIINGLADKRFSLRSKGNAPVQSQRMDTGVPVGHGAGIVITHPKSSGFPKLGSVSL